MQILTLDLAQIVSIPTLFAKFPAIDLKNQEKNGKKLWANHPNPPEGATIRNAK